MAGKRPEFPPRGVEGADRGKNRRKRLGEGKDEFFFVIVEVVERGGWRMEVDGYLKDCAEDVPKVVEGTVELATLLVVKEEGVEVNGAAGLGELEAVPEVREAEAFLNNDAEPCVGSLHEEFVQYSGVHQENTVHGCLRGKK
jgi:hypothetical protein